MRYLYILLLLIPLNIFATHYHVKVGGGGDYTTIAQVNAATFNPGDSILFNRGDTWREQLIPDNGSVSGYIYYGAYGTGAKPKLLGSVTANSGWSEVSANIWQNSNAAFTADVGNLIFNNEASCGVKIMSANPTLDAQGEFWYDFINDRIRMYSVGDPATFYSNIEAVVILHIIDISAKSYIKFQNLDIRYGGYGFQGYGTDHINIYDCDISYIGGTDVSGEYTLRAGNGIEFINNATNNRVERCYVSQCYDAGITAQGTTAARSAHDVYFLNNIIADCEYSTELWMKGTGSSMYNIYFDNNTCLNAGSGWGHDQRPDGVNGRHLMVYTNTATTSAVYVRNNIFYNATESLILFSDASDVAKFTLNYNCLYQSSGYIGRIANMDYSTIANWRTASGQDSNSIENDPLFSGFRLSSSSPALNIGLDVNNDYDFDLHRRILPDIGAYEFGTWIIKKNGMAIKVNNKMITKEQ